MELHIGAGGAGPNRGEGAHLGQGQRHDAAVGGEVPQDRPQQAHATELGVEAGRIRAQPPHHGHAEVVLQVLANCRAVRHHGDTEFLQRAAGAYAGGLQQSRGLERAGGHDDLARSVCGNQAPALTVLHAGSTTLGIDEDACRQGLRGNLHVFANAALRPQVALGGGPASTVPDVRLKVADAELLCAVEVLVARQAGGLARRDDGVAERVAQCEVGNVERAARAVPFIGTARLVLGLAEPRQHVLPAPVGQPFRCPVVVVLVLPAHIKHAVDGGRAAQPLAPRQAHATATQCRFRYRVEQPAELRVVRDGAEAVGHVDERVTVAATGFQQQHPGPGPFAEAARQCATGRTGTNDDVVECGLHLPVRSQGWCRRLRQAQFRKLAA